MNSWDELPFWKSEAWTKIQEKLDESRKNGATINPTNFLMFHSLDVSPLEKTKVVVVGQDPYPNPDHCTGLAFSLPASYELRKAPETWKNIKRELCTDLHVQAPRTGSLESWAKQGVLLWNAIPTCEAWKSLSHEGWKEWEILTVDIISCLSKQQKGSVFIFLGSIARRYLEYVKEPSKSICTSHPSPRGAYQSNPYLGVVPFIGSRIFSKTNDYLCQLGHQPVDWRL